MDNNINDAIKNLLLLKRIQELTEEMHSRNDMLAYVGQHCTDLPYELAIIYLEQTIRYIDTVVAPIYSMMKAADALQNGRSIKGMLFNYKDQDE